MASLKRNFSHFSVFLQGLFFHLHPRPVLCPPVFWNTDCSIDFNQYAEETIPSISSGTLPFCLPLKGKFFCLSPLLLNSVCPLEPRENPQYHSAGEKAMRSLGKGSLHELLCECGLQRVEKNAPKVVLNLFIPQGQIENVLQLLMRTQKPLMGQTETYTLLTRSFRMKT